MVSSSSNMHSGFDYFGQVALGLVPGVKAVKKFGAATIGTTQSTVWDGGTLYTYLTSATELFVASTDVDDNSAGTGARKVTVYGLDENWLEKTQQVDMNGQTAVSVGTFIRVNRMTVDTAGSSQGAEGTVRCGYGTFTAGVPANILAAIDNGNNQTLMALYSVPADKYALAYTYFNTSVKSGEITFDSFVREFGSIFQLKRRVENYEGTFLYPNDVPLLLPPKSDIEIRGKAAAVSTACSAGFDMLVIDADKDFR